MDGWNISFLLGWPILRGYVLKLNIQLGGDFKDSWNFRPHLK